MGVCGAAGLPAGGGGFRTAGRPELGNSDGRCGLPFRRTARTAQRRSLVRASVLQDGPARATAFVGAGFRSAGRPGLRSGARAGQRRPPAPASVLQDTLAPPRDGAVLKNARRLLDSGRTGFSRSPSAPSVRSRIRRRGSLLADPHTEGERDVCDSAIEMSAVRPGDGRRDRRLAVRSVRRRLRLTVPPVGLEPTLERF